MAFKLGLPSLTDQLASIGILGSQVAKTGELFKKEPYIVTADLKRKVAPIIKENWNKYFRYDFSIGVARNDGSISNMHTAQITDSNMAQYFTGNKVTLYLAPQNISISTPFACNVTATNHGVLEENNGTVFRDIVISGTTGVNQDRNNAHSIANPLGNVFTSFLPQTATAINNLISQAKSIATAITGNDPKKIDISLERTGYFQFWVLYNFLVAYAEAKKKINGNRLRLIFNDYKDNIAFICTPVSFELKRDKSEPLLYRYSIQLRSWDIGVPDGAQDLKVLENVPKPDNVNVIKSITNTITSARDTINGARNVLSGVHSDFANIMNVYNQGTLVMKELAGFAEDVRDFPQIIANNADVLLVGSTNATIAAMDNAFSSSRQGVIQKIGFSDAMESESGAPSGATADTIQAAANGDPFSPKSVAINSKLTMGGEDKPVQNARMNTAKSALNKAMDNAAFQQTTIDQLNVPPSVQDQMENQRQSARDTTSNQIRQLSANLKEISDNYSQSVGMMDSVYASTYGLPIQTTTGKVPTEEDILTAVSLEESRDSFVGTLATGEIFKERNPDPFVSANTALPESDQMPSPGSAIPVFFQRGQTLEKLAQQYLGDPNRSREIAILNGLRAPYIDEVGFTRNISGADGRIFVVSDNSNLAINQSVTISGTAVASTRRHIVNIESIGGGQYRVTVDGADNLSIYGPSTSPKITARIPGTVGPGDVILMPNSSIPIDASPNRPTPLYNRLSQAEKVFKIDIALNNAGTDLAVDAGGDVKRSYGYQNATQAIRLAVETEKGEIEQHLDYGLAVPVGQMNSQLSIQDMGDLIRQRVVADPRFADANVSVSFEGSVVNVNVTALGAQGTGAVPVNFEIGKA